MAFFPLFFTFALCVALSSSAAIRAPNSNSNVTSSAVDLGPHVIKQAYYLPNGSIAFKYSASSDWLDTSVSLDASDQIREARQNISVVQGLPMREELGQGRKHVAKRDASWSDSSKDHYYHLVNVAAAATPDVVVGPLDEVEQQLPAERLSQAQSRNKLRGQYVIAAVH